MRETSWQRLHLPGSHRSRPQTQQVIPHFLFLIQLRPWDLVLPQWSLAEPPPILASWIPPFPNCSFPGPSREGGRETERERERHHCHHSGRGCSLPKAGSAWSPISFATLHRPPPPVYRAAPSSSTPKESRTPIRQSHLLINCAN